jgi:hypothetical protein
MNERVVQRFWSHVTKSDGCWLWTGFKDRDGYGKFFVQTAGGRSIKAYAHRFAYEMFVGPIPAGYQVDHLCRIRDCIRFDHLEAVTPQENNRRSNSLSACRARQTRCLRGHDFNDANMRINPDGRRDCRVCDREDKRLIRLRKRAAA